MTDPDYGEYMIGWKYIIQKKSGWTFRAGPQRLPIVNDQWQFPNGTIIQEGGYLLVWMDKNAGFHANFKLKSGSPFSCLMIR
ncbi:MAG: hypothetical protein R3B93_09950 [Bacteroidia bacterium]